MRFCIYLKKTEPEVIFSSGEHIFPAGIGGIQKLPVEYVSHDCNNAFSAMELPFMRNSLIALPRQIYGPGKRGKLDRKHATKSAVSLMNGVNESGNVEFGYISLGHPYSISQIKMNVNGTCQFISDRTFGEVNKQVADFEKNLNKYSGRYQLYQDERLDSDEFLLGLHDGKWHVALSNIELESSISDFVERLLTQKPFDNQSPNYGTVQIRVQQSIQFDDRYFRVCAKIVFNYLAFVKGQNFVLNDRFNPLRDWIVNGGENKFAVLSGEQTNLVIPFPDKAHKILIVQYGKSIKGLISFYGNSFETLIHLCDDFEDIFQLEGFVCDWQNSREFRLNDYINLIAFKS